MHMFILVIVMISAGILGGGINYYLNKNEPGNKNTAWEFIIIGIGASLLVPLFLNMISSDLIQRSEAGVYNIFVILGFCLIAAISSKAFITSLSDKILKEAKEAKEYALSSVKRIDKVQDEIDPLIRRNLETDPDEGDIQPELSDTTDQSIRVLSALNRPDFTYRSISGIIKGTDIDADRAKIREILLLLEKDGYVRSIDRGKGPRYYITGSGLQHLIDNASNKSLERDAQ